ncbi:MAG: HD domain-containing protein [Bacillota bacterium]
MDLNFRMMREEQETSSLNEFAMKSSLSRGRKHQESDCDIRLAFERDANRILYSVDFRRLRHKTQVFFDAQNDHICTRMEHVLYVSSISSTIARSLGLNQDLTHAISLGHDLGHAPFGHLGERTLDDCVKKHNSSISFRHELHSLRVVDRLATRVSDGKTNHKKGLNLTFEVRDGIVSHCGEKIRENMLTANRDKSFKDLENLKIVAAQPATLEACIVRIVDKISYVGRDIEDALRVKLLDVSDIPMEVQKVLGNNNAEIINTLVLDMVNTSFHKDLIGLSDEKGEALSELIKHNYQLIYENEKIKRFGKQVENIMQGLFEYFHSELKDPNSLLASEDRIDRIFSKYITENDYSQNTAPEQMVIDFIAGMTDKFATKCFEEIYWM